MLFTLFQHTRKHYSPSTKTCKKWRGKKLQHAKKICGDFSHTHTHRRKWKKRCNPPSPVDSHSEHHTGRRSCELPAPRSEGNKEKVRKEKVEKPKLTIMHHPTHNQNSTNCLRTPQETTPKGDTQSKKKKHHYRERLAKAQRTEREKTQKTTAQENQTHSHFPTSLKAKPHPSSSVQTSQPPPPPPRREKEGVWMKRKRQFLTTTWQWRELQSRSKWNSAKQTARKLSLLCEPSLEHITTLLVVLVCDFSQRQTHFPTPPKKREEEGWKCSDPFFLAHQQLHTVLLLLLPHAQRIAEWEGLQFPSCDKHNEGKEKNRMKRHHNSFNGNWHPIPEEQEVCQ